MTELPVGWTSIQIGELCELSNGRAFKPEEWSEVGLPIIRIQNLNRPNAEFNHFNGELDARHLVMPGQLLFAWSGTPGTSFGAHVWNGPKAALNQHIFKVDFDRDHIDGAFLRHAINQRLDDLIDSAQGGVGLRHVTKGTFEKTQIALPPYAEQRRIAQKLDALLAQVAILKTRIDALPSLIKRLRSQVVHFAVSGDLTKDFRGDRRLTWRSVELGDIIQSRPRNGYSPKAVGYETATRSLSLSATTTGKFKGEFFKYIDEEIPLDSHLWLHPGDILIQRANTLEYVGVSAIYDGLPNEFIYPDLMMKCRASECTSPAFLHLALSSGHVRKYFRDHATGTAGNMPKINQQTVISTPISLPSSDEQAEIVSRVEQLFAFADQLDSKVGTTKQHIDALSQSLLAKAFRGELVPQDPNDESANTLLERIRARRVASSQPKRGRKASSN